MRRIAALAGFVVFTAIALPLFERVPNLIEVSLAGEQHPSPLTLVRILPERGAVPAGQGRTHRTRLATKDTDRILQHKVIQLLVGTFGTSPDLDRAELAIEGTSCVYASHSGLAFPNNSTLELVQGAGCVPLSGTPTGRLELSVKLRNQARLALWTHPASPTSVTNQTMFVDPSPEPMGPEIFVVSGRLVNEAPVNTGPRRVDLLAYVWQVGSGSWWIWIAVSFGALAVSIGFVGLWSPPPPVGATPRFTLFRALAAFMVAGGLGVLYSVLTPPFQTPDEPHHIVAFSEVTGRAELVPQIDAWAALAHVVRLRFRPDERFKPSDVGKPGAIWDHQNAPDSLVRGGGVHLLWRAVAPLFRSMRAPQVLLGLRLTNALCLAVLVGIFVALVVRYGQVPSPHLLAFPVLLVPTLPFFGMHVSNHAPLVGAYVLVAGGLTLIVLNRRHDHISGLMTGVGWAAAIALSRSALPLAPLIAFVAGARMLYGPIHQRILSAGTFWAGLTLPVLLVLSLTHSEYVAGNTSVGGSVLPQAVQTLLQTMTRWPWLLAAAIPVLATFEWVLAHMRARVGQRLRSAIGIATRRGAVGAAAALLMLMIGSIFFRYPALARIDPLNRPSAGEYARDAVMAGLTTLRFGAPDYMTSVTFWGGFGWLETLAAGWFVSLLSSATGLALVALLIHVGRTSDTRRAFLLLAAVAGFAAALAAYAISLSQLIPIDLVGRYLFGLYLSMVVLCWSGISLIPVGPSRERWQSSVSLACVLACTAVHMYCLRLLLYRYF